MKPILVSVIVNGVMFAMGIHVREVSLHISVAIAFFMSTLRTVTVSRVVTKLVAVVAMETLWIKVQYHAVHRLQNHLLVHDIVSAGDRLALTNFS